MINNLRMRLDGRVKTAIVVGLVALLLIVVGGYFLLSAPGEKPLNGKCLLSDKKPQIFSPKLIATQDAKNAVKFAGYIETHDSHYMLVDVDQMTLVDGKDGKISLADECIKLEMSFQVDAKKIASLSNLEWNFKSDTEGSKEEYAHCKVDASEKNVFAHKFPADKNRYSCLDTQEHQCWGKRNKEGKLAMLAKIVIEIFELELDGNEKKIRAGTFSKPEFPQSCSQ